MTVPFVVPPALWIRRRTWSDRRRFGGDSSERALDPKVLKMNEMKMKTTMMILRLGSFSFCSEMVDDVWNLLYRLLKWPFCPRTSRPNTEEWLPLLDLMAGVPSITGDGVNFLLV